MFNSIFKISNVIKTNNVLDDLIGGGIPHGKILEIAGDVDVGKTSFIFDLIESINDDMIVAYISTSKNSLCYLYKRKLNEKKNLVLCLSNREDTILDFILQTVSIIDLFIIDGIHNVLTNNESSTVNISVNQDMKSLLSNLNSLFYGKKSSLIAVNSVNLKNGEQVSRWRNLFNKYCSIRIDLNYKGIEVISHKLKPNLIGGNNYGA